MITSIITKEDVVLFVVNLKESIIIKKALHLIMFPLCDYILA